MSEALFIVNPKRRRRKKGRMPAGLRRYWATHRRNPKMSRTTKKRRRKRRAMGLTVIPTKRYHKRYSKRVTRNPRRRRYFAVSRHRRHRRHTYRNPFSVRGLKHTLMPAAIGATGAVALDVVYAYASPYLPHSMQTGLISSLVKLAGAIGLGIGARKFLGREKGNAVALGALTVTGYGVIKPLIAQFAPTIKGLSGYADYVNYPMSAGQGIGAYIPGTTPRLGFISPSPTLPPSGEQLGAYMARGGPQMAGFGGFGDASWMNDGM